MIFKKLHADAKEPVRSTQHSAGLDIFALEASYISPGKIEVIDTGITFENARTQRENFFSEELDWFIDLRIRSSMAIEGVMLANGAGVIDRDYAGKSIKVILFNSSNDRYYIKAGQKIAQMIIMEHMSRLAKGVTFKYDKRTGGLGSTNDETH